MAWRAACGNLSHFPPFAPLRFLMTYTSSLSLSLSLSLALSLSLSFARSLALFLALSLSLSLSRSLALSLSPPLSFSLPLSHTHTHILKRVQAVGARVDLNNLYPGGNAQIQVFLLFTFITREPSVG